MGAYSRRWCSANVVLHSLCEHRGTPTDRHCPTAAHPKRYSGVSWRCPRSCGRLPGYHLSLAKFFDRLNRICDSILQDTAHHKHELHHRSRDWVMGFPRTTWALPRRAETTATKVLEYSQDSSLEAESVATRRRGRRRPSSSLMSLANFRHIFGRASRMLSSPTSSARPRTCRSPAAES